MFFVGPLELGKCTVMLYW